MNVFVSYSHEDEWLKNEFITAMSGLARTLGSSVWQDRSLLPGADLNAEIQSAINRAQVVVCLVSPDYIQSDYCFEKEFEYARGLAQKGDLEIVSIIVRECAWESLPFSEYVCLPQDGVPVNPGKALRDNKELRDTAWRNVAKEMERLLAELSARVETKSSTEVLHPEVLLREDHLSMVREQSSLSHAKVADATAEEIRTEPRFSSDTDNKLSLTFGNLLDRCQEDGAVVLSGDELSGKTTVLYMLQQSLASKGVPSVVISGRDIKNRGVTKFLQQAIKKQLVNENTDAADTIVLIDDLDACRLKDNIQRAIVREILRDYRNLVIVAPNSLYACVFDGASLMNAGVYEIMELSKAQVQEVVRNWVTLGDDGDIAQLEAQAVSWFKLVIGVLKDAEVGWAPGQVVNLLKILDASQGTDLAITSNASCYDALATAQLSKAGVAGSEIDLYKNALGFMAIEVWGKRGSLELPIEVIQATIRKFDEEYLVSMSNSFEIFERARILHRVGDHYEFSSKAMLFFFAGRYLARYAKEKEKELYTVFVDECIDNIHLRDYANTLLYCLYFNTDVDILERLMARLDSTLGEIEDWKLDDKFNELAGKENSILELVQQPTDYREQRMRSLAEPYQELYEKEADLAERYISPFSQEALDIDGNEPSDSGGNGYFDTMNALFRLQAVLASAIKTRAGTFDRATLMRAVSSIVRASGRFCHLNVWLAAELLVDAPKFIEQLTQVENLDRKRVKSPEGTAERKRELDKFVYGTFDRYVQLFTRLSVVVSQGVCGRLLAESSVLRATEILHRENELNESGSAIEGNPYNFAVAGAVAKVWRDGKIDREYYEQLLDDYGSEGPFFDVVRMVLYVFSRYMPIEISDRHWLHEKMKIKLEGTRVRQHLIADRTS